MQYVNLDEAELPYPDLGTEDYNTEDVPRAESRNNFLQYVVVRNIMTFHVISNFLLNYYASIK